MINSIFHFHSIISTITLYTCSLSALMSIEMLLSNRNDIKNKIFFGLFLSFSLNLFYVFLCDSKLIIDYPYISVICLTGMFLTGPMIYFLTLFSVDKTLKLNRKQYWHIAPAIFFLIIRLIVVCIHGYKPLSVYLNLCVNKLIPINAILGSLIYTLYLIASGKKFIKNYLWNFNNLKNEPSALASFILFIIISIAAITNSLTYFTQNNIFLQVSGLLLSICVILLLILNLIFPEFDTVITKIVEKEKQKRFFLSNIDIDQLKSKIDYLIGSEEVFTDEHLTLEKLASLAEVHSYQLSKFINKYYSKNFITFINEYRVDKAKKLLISNPEYTILAVAYESGFHSKSVFNVAFRKITGITPREFRNKNMS